MAVLRLEPPKRTRLAGRLALPLFGLGARFKGLDEVVDVEDETEGE